MRKGILIALLVPAVAFAGPRKRPKAKAKKAATEDTTEKTDPAPTPTATPTPTGLGAGSGSGSGSMPSTLNGTPQAAGTTPTSGTTPTTTGTAPTTGTPATGTSQPNPNAGNDKPSTDEGTKDADVDTLRQEYQSLRDELFKSRARANAVASQLYSTRMTIRFTWGSARYYGVSKASIRLDGATVFENASGAIATDDGVRFDGYVAPGRHLVTFHVEATGKDDDSFTSATETQIVVKAVGNKDLVVAAKGHDNGDIAYEWKKSEKGSYGLGIDVTVKSVANGAAPAKGKK